MSPGPRFCCNHMGSPSDLVYSPALACEVSPLHSHGHTEKFTLQSSQRLPALFLTFNSCTACPAWAGLSCPIPLWVLSCADLHGMTCTSIFSLQDRDQHSQRDLGSPFQLSQRLDVWPSDTWSSPVKIKIEFKSRNYTLRTRCSSWAKPFWVNTLQRAQIIPLQTLGICIYLNIYKILLFLDNGFML